jgi:hypothetical protein
MLNARHWKSTPCPWPQDQQLPTPLLIRSARRQGRDVLPHGRDSSRRHCRWSAGHAAAGKQNQPTAQANDTGDDNADNDRAPTAPCKHDCGTDRSPKEDLLCFWGSSGLPPRSPRKALACHQVTAVPTTVNEQHSAAPRHHPANTACPRRAVRSRTCLHLLIAGSILPFMTT